MTDPNREVFKPTKAQRTAVWNARHGFIGALNRIVLKEEKKLPRDVYVENLRKFAEAVKADRQRLVIPSVEVIGKFSYARQSSHRYDIARRTRTTIGKIARKQYGFTPDQIPDQWLGKVSSLLRLFIWEDDESIRILKGQDVVEVYRDGPHSCMSEHCCKYTQVYADNPEAVSIVAYYQDGRSTPSARALLWTDVTINPNTKDSKRTRFLDRVYPNHGTGNDAIRMWAEAQTDLVVRCGDGAGGSHGRMVVQLKRLPSNGYWPYMDTLCYVDRDNLEVYSYNPPDKYYLIYADSQYGGLGSGDAGDSDQVTCDQCNERVSEDDTLYWNDEYYCEYCRDDQLIYCDSCSDYGHSERSVETTNGDTICEGCATDGTYVQCCECDMYAPTYDGYLTDTDGENYCHSCGEESLVQCTCCEEYIREGDEVEVEDENYCDSCSVICEVCNEPTLVDTSILHDGKEMCPTCYEETVQPELQLEGVA